MSVRQGLLALLDREPMYGYQLKAEFEAGTGQVWPLNIGQVYTTLARLERDGLVEAEEPDGEGHQHYRITATGRDELRTWFATPVRRDSPPRDELAMKLLLALGAGDVSVVDVIQAQRTATMEALQELTRLKSAADPIVELAWVLMLDAMLLQAEAEVRWLDVCEARLRMAGRTIPAVPVMAAAAPEPVEAKEARR